jgi:hypothetical protein
MQPMVTIAIIDARERKPQNVRLPREIEYLRFFHSFDAFGARVRGSRIRQIEEARRRSPTRSSFSMNIHIERRSGSFAVRRGWGCDGSSIFLKRRAFDSAQSNVMINGERDTGTRIANIPSIIDGW